METPCIRTCEIEPLTGWCRGCGRDLDEITRWRLMTDTERHHIMSGLAARLARMAEKRSLA